MDMRLDFFTIFYLKKKKFSLKNILKKISANGIVSSVPQFGRICTFTAQTIREIGKEAEEWNRITSFRV